MKWKIFLVGAMTCLLLEGCVTMDMPYTLREHWDERIGVLTYDEMVKNHGEPQSTNPLPDGGWNSRWHLQNVDTSDQMQPYYSWDNMVLTFDSKGILRNWETYH